MKAWKKSIISLAVALCLFAGFVPVPANVAAAISTDVAVTNPDYKYNFALYQNNYNAPNYEAWCAAYEAANSGASASDVTNMNTTATMSLTLVSGTEVTNEAVKLSSVLQDARGYDSSKDEAYGDEYADWSLSADGYDKAIMNQKTIANEQGRISFQGVNAGLYIQANKVGQHATIRIKVPEAGWFSPQIEVWYNVSTKSGTTTVRGSSFRAYIAPVSSADVRADEYSIGMANCVDDEDTPSGTDKEYGYQTMRTMYFPTAGEYAFTVVPEIVGTYETATNTSSQILIRSLTLTKMADANTPASEVANLTPSIDLDAVIDTSVSIAGDEIKSFAVDNTALGDSIYNKLMTSDVDFVSTGVGASLAKDCSSIDIVGDTKGSGELTISLERDGVTATDSITGINVTSDSAVAHAITYNFVEGDSGTRVQYEATNWSTNAESHSSVYQKESAVWRYGQTMQILTGAVNRWITIRIKVDRPGWYETSLWSGVKNSGGVFRAYISNTEDEVAVENRKAVYCTDKNSIGKISSYKAGQTSGVPKDATEVMRTVYLEKSGWYAFTLEIEETGADNGTAIFIKNLVLDRVALKDTLATDSSIPKMSSIVAAETATVAANASTEINLAPVMSNSAYEDLVGVTVTANSSTDNASATVADGKLTVTGAKAGEAVITLTATDPYGVVSTDAVTVTVTEPAVTCFGNTYAYIVGNDNEGYKLYIFGAIDSDNYQRVGFNVGGTDKAGTTKIYETVNVNYTANGEAATPVELTAADFGLERGYVFYHVEDVSGITAETDFAVKAYAVDLEDANKVTYGDAVTISVAAAN